MIDGIRREISQFISQLRYYTSTSLERRVLLGLLKKMYFFIYLYHYYLMWPCIVNTAFVGSIPSRKNIYIFFIW